MSSDSVVRPAPSVCPECGKNRVIADGVSTLRVARSGAGPIGKGLTNNDSEFWALVCVGCGHTTLYAKNPSHLLDSHATRQPA